MNQSLLLDIKKAAYLEGEFTTRAGKKTNYYIDKYRFETLPHILIPLAKEIAKRLPDPSAYDIIAGPELGAVPICTLVACEVNKPFIIVRKEPKGYGTNHAIEGQFIKQDRVVVIEDILTTGGAVLKACQFLKNAQLNVIKIIGVVNREEGAIENIHQAGYPNVEAIFTTTDLKTVG